MVTPRRPSLSSALCYRDPKAALDWLARAFGFERAIVVTTPAGDIAHAEMTFGDGLVMVGGAWADCIASPEDTGGRNTQHVHVHLPDDADIDAHCERARAAGAEILQPPADQFYGDRTYRARDPGRHVWTFGKHVRDVTNDEMRAATGLTIHTFH
ncbi:VOC family protein [Burkholderia vietnamiensis]|uniref:VOC family protein n=1 Tax=Burkholderia vietnamiensis TaxID=60552 RepID=UPI001588CEC8|nr:VOC family protein [Burkholderia vietnamiensis]MEC4597890.1 VOC family protein [Burkholderia vietnamiensis]HDR9147753.1 VOC family protein [Burkholderia vietnamiensis]